MGQTLYYILIGLFVGLLFFNIYFRFKILKHFKVLRRNKVRFEWKHIKSKKLLESEVVPNYPQFEDDIKSFVNEIHFSFKVVMVIIILMLIIGLLVRTQY